MSGSITLSTAPLTDAEKVDVRRFCGYSLYGNSASGFMGMRFYQAQGMMEYRMLNAAPAELQVIRQYLATIYSLEASVPGAGANLDTDQAAVWTRNKTEVADRARLFDDWCKRLCAFFGVPAGPGLNISSGQIVI